nr:hypothetical protein [Tanacetum cinerariifolium]
MSNELDLLFSLMFDELLNGSSKVVSKSSAISAADALTQQSHAETNQVADDEFINIFSTPIQDHGETSSRHVDSSNKHTFYQRYPSEYRWTKDHPLEQVIGNPSQSMASAHNSSDPHLHVRRWRQLITVLTPHLHTTALEHDSLSPGRKCQENVSHEDRTVTTSNELDLLFSPCLMNCSMDLLRLCLKPHTDNDQVADDEFINIFSTPVQDQGETSSRHVDSSNMHTFYQRYPSKHRWTKDHPLEKVIGNPLQSIRTRRQLESDAEMCMFMLTERIVLKITKINKTRTISTQDQKPQRKAGSGSKFSSNNLTLKPNLSKFQSLRTSFAQRSKPNLSKVKCQSPGTNCVNFSKLHEGLKLPSFQSSR